MEKEIIIITGAAGFIGSSLVRHLNEKGLSNLLLVDDLKQGQKWKNLVSKSFIDLISKEELFDYLYQNKSNPPQVKAIFHLGACSDTLETDASYLLENNYHYSVQLATWALEQGSKFVFASSAATYGDGALGFQDDEEKLLTLKPINMYAFSKHLFDLWAKREGVFSKIVSLKFFNVFGPNEYHKGHMSSMIFKMYKKALNGESIGLFKSNDPEYKDGGQKRDFVYVKDVVNMTSSFLFENSGVNGLFNIGSGNASTWNEVAQNLFAALGKEPNIKYIEMPADLSRQYQNFTQADVSKFQKKCKNFSSRSLKESIFDYVQNYLLKEQTW